MVLLENKNICVSVCMLGGINEKHKDICTQNYCRNLKNIKDHMAIP